MRRLRRSSAVGALVFASVFHVLAPAELLAQGAPAPADTVAVPIDQARELIKSGDNDRAIEVLKDVISKEKGSLSRLREAYLLLIKSYVFLGNDFKLKPQGREASNLNYRAAREVIAECLKVKALRHTQPEPASEYPPEMLSFFGEVRARMFGSFTVTELSPATAVALFDADTLRALPGSGARGDVDLAVGRHVVVLRAPGHKDVSEEVTISPNTTLERSYRLEKNHGAWWYTSRAGAVIGATSLGLALRRHKPGTTEQPLPAAPPPPAQ